MDAVQFGVMMIMNLAIGTVTPPVGSVLFVGCSVANLKIERVMKNLVPYFAAIIVMLLFVTFVPAVSEWLPKAFGMM
jgi:TRAP-type C4-dicarboxylate transport system permease large subunit